MPPLKKKRKKKSKIYFGTPVHDAIVRYNQSDNSIVRNKIYTEEIHTAFLKLAENIINTFKLNISWTKKQIVDQFFEMIPNFKYKDTEKYLDSKM